MHNVTFLQDMAVVMTVSAIVTIVFHQLRLPVVLGYILAGIIIGPFTPPFPLVTNVQSIETLSELGIIFLLFGIGLEFSLGKLLKVGLIAVAAATLEITLMFFVGFTVGRFFAWSFMDSLFLGAILAISSTTIIAKILMDGKKLQEKFAQIILGILVVEDIVAIVIIAILSGLASTGEITFGRAVTDLLKVGAFITGVLFCGTIIIPRLLKYVYSFASSEVMIITVLGLCFAVSLMAAKLGFSVALGAFLVGAIIAETIYSRFIIRHFESIKDMFTAVFFVTIGMMFDPQVVMQFKVPVLILTAVTILGKVFGCSFAVFLTGNNPSTSLLVGLGMAQIGEFSFIIAQMGQATGVTSSYLFPIAVSVSILTTVTAPFRMQYADPITNGIFRYMPKPLVVFAGLYSGWIEKIRIAQGDKSRRPLFFINVKKYLPRIIFYLISLFGLYRIEPGIVSSIGISPFLGQVIMLVVMFPFVLGLFYAIDAILWQTFLQPFINQKNSSQGNEAQNALHHVLRFAMIVVYGLFMLMLTPIFMPQIHTGFIVLGILILSASVLWGSVRKLHATIEKTVLNFFDHENLTEAQAEQTHDELVKLIQTKYPWSVETQDFLLPLEQSGVNVAIAGLGLREKTGVSIVAVYRDEKAIVNPAADTILLPGDVLLLMGSKEQLVDANRFLHQKIKGNI